MLPVSIPCQCWRVVLCWPLAASGWYSAPGAGWLCSRMLSIHMKKHNYFSWVDMRQLVSVSILKNILYICLIFCITINLHVYFFYYIFWFTYSFSILFSGWIFCADLYVTLLTYLTIKQFQNPPQGNLPKTSTQKEEPTSIVFT